MSTDRRQVVMRTPATRLIDTPSIRRDRFCRVRGTGPIISRSVVRFNFVISRRERRASSSSSSSSFPSLGKGVRANLCQSILREKSIVVLTIMASTVCVCIFVSATNVHNVHVAVMATAME